MDDITEIVTVVETVEVSDTESVVEVIETFTTLEVFAPEVIAEEQSVIEIITESVTEQISEAVPVIEVITDEGRQGPPGPPGLSEEDIVYAKRVDTVNAGLLYRGEAATGSAEGDPVWRIRRLTINGTGSIIDVAEQWAEGSAEFKHAWADRLTLTYI